jgi:hypothetical protein
LPNFPVIRADPFTMKKLPGLLLLIIIALQPGCKKSNDTIGETYAHILYGGDPAVDGRGYFIKLDGTQEDVVAINLPANYQTPEVNAAVALKFVDTGERRKIDWASATLGLRVIYIVTLRKL